MTIKLTVTKKNIQRTPSYPYIAFSTIGGYFVVTSAVSGVVLGGGGAGAVIELVASLLTPLNGSITLTQELGYE